MVFKDVNVCSDISPNNTVYMPHAELQSNAIHCKVLLSKCLDHLFAVNLSNGVSYFAHGLIG
jgi:hypothetical protein